MSKITAKIFYKEIVQNFKLMTFYTSYNINILNGTYFFQPLLTLFLELLTFNNKNNTLSLCENEK